MHKLILWFFKNAKNIVQFLSIICSFFAAVISLCWVEVIIGVNWTWLHFIKPVINPILDFSGQIMPLSFNFFGTDFDMKYLISIALLFLLVYLCRKALDLFLDFLSFCIFSLLFDDNLGVLFGFIFFFLFLVTPCEM